MTKQLFFWHGMLNDLTTTIDSWKACPPSQKRKVITSQTMLKAAFSFQECAANLFILNGNEFIILVDRLTGFLCCDKVKKNSTSAILIKLTNWFNILGWPETIRTDGGPQFRSEFDEFCKSFYICHELSSPYHPESNGLAEAAVKNAKTLLKKCELTGQNFQRSQSVFRNMPRSDGPSPVQLLFKLPQQTNILLPPWPLPSVNSSSALATREQHIAQHTAAINKRAFSYNCLPIGSKVHVQNTINKLWDHQATVVALRNNGEYYVVHDILDQPLLSTTLTEFTFTMLLRYSLDHNTRSNSSSMLIVVQQLLPTCSQ